MSEKKNMFKILKIIIVFIIFLTMPMLSSCNEPVKNKFSNPNITLKSIQPDENVSDIAVPMYKNDPFYKIGDIFTQDVLDENGNKKFKITIERLPDLLQTTWAGKGFLFDNGKVYVCLNLYDPKTKSFSLLNIKDITPFLYKISNHKYFYFPLTIYDSEKDKFQRLPENEIQKIRNKRSIFASTRKKSRSGKTSLTETKELYKNKCLLSEGNMGVLVGCEGIWLEDIVNLKRYKYGKFNIKRDMFDAVLLKNGKILIIGGVTASPKNHNEKNYSLNTIELYEPETGDISIVGEMQYPRAMPKSILLNNGKVLIIDGSDKGYLNNAEVFDPETGKTTFTKTVANLEYSTYRQDILLNSEFFELVLLKDGKVLLLGLIGSIYDPETNTFYPIKNLKIYRTMHQLTVLQDGKILLTGGTIPDDYSPSSGYKSAELITIENY